MMDLHFARLRASRAGAVYFAIAAFDDWRVRGRRFAENPRVLFGCEVLRIRELDPAR
jgi:hypothetical protein